MEEERKKTQLDYPASHSIDTYWFAVDKDGRLACICSGEEGTLPADIEKSNDDYEMTDDAMFINSEPICDGCRKFILSEEHLAFVFSQDKTDYISTDDNNQNTLLFEDSSLERKAIELGDNIRFDDLYIWKERINDGSTIIYELSEDHRYIYCCNIVFNKGALKKDVESGNITEIFYDFESILYTSYNTNPYTYVPVFEREETSLSDTIKFKLPKDFHGIKKLELSFSESDEFNLDDYTGVYTMEYEDRDRDDEDLFIWPNYDGVPKEILVKKLFTAINKLRSRSVWCLLDKYSVPSDSVDPVTGETALEVTKRLYEKYNGEEMQWHGPGLSCFRILKMIQLKEKQRVSN